MEQLSPVQKITQSLRASVGATRGIATVCSQCNSMFTSTHNRGQLYCSRSCSKKAMWANFTPEEEQARTAKVSASMIGRPTWNKGLPWSGKVKAKLSQAHKASGHRPKTRGGNGKAVPCELMAQEMLPKTWRSQLTIKTGKKPVDGYPHHYKADFANPKLKKILEIDGNSHRQRKHLDAKKDELLASLGWSVFRVSNETIRSMYTTFKSTGRTTILSLVR